MTIETESNDALHNQSRTKRLYVIPHLFSVEIEDLHM